MIDTVKIKNFGPIPELEWKKLANINLIIGTNSTGKTFLLKILYTLIRSIEEFKRGKEPRNFKDILSEKIFWTFQTEKFSELISDISKAESELEVRMSFDKIVTSDYRINHKSTTLVTSANLHPENNRKANSIFLPAKEVLSIFDLVKSAREQLKIFGLDDTYYDLIKAISTPTQKGKNSPDVAKGREDLEKIFNAKVSYNNESKQWGIKKEKKDYTINLVSEGIKKVSILDILLGNRYFSPDSIVFIDEPESALHPEAISKFMDIIYTLSKTGAQFFIATHSYFVIKKLYLIAKKENINLPLLSIEKDKFPLVEKETLPFPDLKDGLPDNPIITESINLYKQEAWL